MIKNSFKFEKDFLFLKCKERLNFLSKIFEKHKTI